MLTETCVYYSVPQTPGKSCFFKLTIHHNNRNKSINFIFIWNLAGNSDAGGDDKLSFFLWGLSDLVALQGHVISLFARPSFICERLTGSPGRPPFYTTQVLKRKIAVELDFHPGGGVLPIVRG